MPFVTFTVRRGLSAADRSRLSEAMLEAQVAAGYHRADRFHRFLEVDQDDLLVDPRFPDYATDRTDRFMVVEVVISSESPTGAAAIAAAWSVAGLMDATMTLDLVSRRANAMDAPSRPGDGLLFVRGLPYGAVEDLCNRHDAAIAIVNPGDAFVLGGPGVELDIIADVAKRMGAARAVRLAVNVASHTPRLAAASSEFRKILDQTPTKLAPDSNVRLFSGIDGSPVVNISAGLNKLAKQISHTVQWARCLEGCVEAGASVFFELGPGRALNEMAAGAYPDISARSLEDFRTLQGARAWLARVVN
jgi:[acyl-carrier-protein] S-malonyltransferase